MRFYKFALWKSYFERGYALLSYPKYILFLIGLGDVIASDGNYTRVIIIGILLGIACFVTGYFMYNKGFVEAEQEVQNRHDLFVKQMRASGAIRFTEKLK